MCYKTMLSAKKQHYYWQAITPTKKFNIIPLQAKPYVEVYKEEGRKISFPHPPHYSRSLGTAPSPTESE